MPGHLRLPARTAVAGLTGYDEGRWWVQDLAASIPARLLGKGDGRTALDLCAAPGGKTMQLAAAGFRVTAVDASESRLARLSENLARTGLAADIMRADVLAWAPAEPVDAILLDAPCSATGIFRRHPDVLHRFRPKMLAELADLQTRMLGTGRGLAEAGRHTRLFRLLAGAGGRRAGRRPLPLRPVPILRSTPSSRASLPLESRSPVASCGFFRARSRPTAGPTASSSHASGD